MSLADGTYLIHSYAEDLMNYYTISGYDGQTIRTVSGGSSETPTEVRIHSPLPTPKKHNPDQTPAQWQVQKHPSSGTYTISAMGTTQGSWTHSQNQTADHIVVFASKPTGWSHHWKLIDVETRTTEPIMGYFIIST
jgi:hypothetical protein